MNVFRKVLTIVAAGSILGVASCAVLGVGSTVAVNTFAAKEHKSPGERRDSENLVHNEKLNAEAADDAGGEAGLEDEQLAAADEGEAPEGEEVPPEAETE